MPLHVLVSAKGSPGTTTTAAALAADAAVHGPTLLVELDPSGGSVQVLTGARATDGLMEAASRLRRDDPREAIGANVVELPRGVPGLFAPAVGMVAESVIEAHGHRWLPALRACAPEVFVDAGRWEPSQRTALRIAGADQVVLVCRPTVEGVEHARHLLDQLREVARCPAVAVIVGDRPYTSGEVAGFVPAPVVGRIAWDPRGVAGLWEHGAGRAWQRSRLARSAGTVRAGLLSHLPRPAQLALPPPHPLGSELAG